MIALFVFLVGLCIGSFLNVVIYRYNTGFTFTGRSKCLSCGKTLAWYELIPLFSFLIQRGACRGCGSKFSWQYPAVEFFTGVIFLASLYTFGFTGQALLSAVIWSLLIVIFVYDLRHKIIPDGIVYSLMVLTLGAGLVYVFSYAHTLKSVLLYVSAGPAVALPFILLWLISRGAWMGFGDAKLALVMGWLVGLNGGYTAVLLAFWTGAFVGLLLMAFGTKKIGMKSELPFAPFLIIGLAIVFFGGVRFTDILNIFSIITYR